MSDDRTQPSDLFDAVAPEPGAGPRSDSAEGEALVEAAERKRRRPRKAQPDAGAEAKAEDGPSEDGEALEPAPSTRRRRRKPAAQAPRDATGDTEPGADGPAPASSAAAPRGPRAWTAACVCAALAVAVLSAAAAANLPRALPVEDRMGVTWLEGPQATQREVDGWLASFPYRDQLAEANGWVLAKLADHLRTQPGVGEVRRIELVHEPVSANGRSRLGRTLRVEMGMRRPYMPGVLASGQRVWIDSDGVVLPGSLPGPEKRRPLVRGLEDSPGSLRASVDAWKRIEPYIDPGLVVGVHCCDLLNDAGDRGIVMTTRTGTRLIWGRPDEDRLGRDTDAKARDLIHTIRCQGDLARVAAVNVRFARPFYTPR